MDWKTWYQEHLCPPQQAVRRIRSGDRVVVAHATGEPSLLLDAMVANAAQYEHVEIVHMVAMGKAEYCQPAYDRNFHHNSFFPGGHQPGRRRGRAGRLHPRLLLRNSRPSPGPPPPQRGPHPGLASG